MIVHYGYMDGSGSYYITINTDFCTNCETHPCISACPEKIFAIITDDYDDKVATVQEAYRHRLKYTCAPCKPSAGYEYLPCVKSCSFGAISHSW